MRLVPLSEMELIRDGERFGLRGTCSRYGCARDLFRGVPTATVQPKRRHAAAVQIRWRPSLREVLVSFGRLRSDPPRLSGASANLFRGGIPEFLTGFAGQILEASDDFGARGGEVFRLGRIVIEIK